MRINKDLIKTIVIGVLIVFIVLLIGIIFLPSIFDSYNNQIYKRGFSDGQVNVVQTQTQTGNMFVINNGTIQGYSLNALCNIVQTQNEIN